MHNGHHTFWHVAAYGNCQTAFHSLWTWGWSLTSRDHSNESDMFMHVKLSWRESWSESYHQGSPCPQKCQQEKVQQKVMFIVAFSYCGILPHMPSLLALQEMMFITDMTLNINCILHCIVAATSLQIEPAVLLDNTHCHIANMTDFFRRWSWEALEHALDSLDMNPCD